jgi:hypothetical protein
MATPAAAVGIRRRRREREDGVCKCVSGVEREHEGLKYHFYSGREGEGTPAGEAAAINGHESLRPSMPSRGGLLMRGNGRNLRREAAPLLRCVFKRRIDGGARGKAGKSTGGGALLRNKGEERGRLEEEGRANGRARVGSERREEGEVGVGRRRESGPR